MAGSDRVLPGARFLPAETRAWLDPGDRAPYGRARAMAALVPAYTRNRRVVTGLGLWFGAVAGVVAGVLGVVLLLDGLALGHAGRLVAGLVLVVAGPVGTVVCCRLGVELLRAGRLLTRALTGWLRDGEGRPRTLWQTAAARRTVYHPPLLVRILLCSLTGLAAVLALSAAGYSFTGLAGATGPDRVVLWLTGLASAVLAVLCAVPAVALARGAARLQRVVVWQVLRDT